MEALVTALPGAVRAPHSLRLTEDIVPHHLASTMRTNTITMTMTTKTIAITMTTGTMMMTTGFSPAGAR